MANCEKCYHAKVCCDYEPKSYSACGYYSDKDLIAEVHHGEWKINCDGYYPYCSECGKEPSGRTMTDYCPHCGAKMKERENETKT